MTAPVVTVTVIEDGRHWTAAELARLHVSPDEDPDDFAPLECAQRQLEALGYQVRGLAGIGIHVIATVQRKDGIMTTKDTLTQIATLIAAGLSPPARADATANTVRQLADIASQGEEIGLTLADAHAGYQELATTTRAGDDARTAARRATCGEIAALIEPHATGPHDASKLGEVFRRVAVHFSGSADPRQQAIAQTAQREADELAEALP